MKNEGFEPIIGLEIHVELKTKSKMFCGCSAEYFSHDPNTHVCPVCLGLPGALPVPNKQAIEWCATLGMALDCEIPNFSKFDRKNYFYPDLPKGYQISQYDLPFCIGGLVDIRCHPERSEGSRDSSPVSRRAQNDNGGKRRIRIRRVHQEEDTGKLIHTRGNPLTGVTPKREWTLIDFNRSGVPLVEIVTEPDIHSAQEAKLFLQKLQQIIRYLGISDCDMEKGSMRLEPNISLTRYTSEESLRNTSEVAGTDSSEVKLPGYKVEVKNINSFRFVERAIDYEIKRQREILEKGETPAQETRGFDERKMVTLPQRGKEEAQDYRYFPEPDIPPMRLGYKDIKILREKIPELPDAKFSRFMREYNLPEYDAVILTATPPIADYFEETVRVGKTYGLTPKQLANVIINKKMDTEKILPAKLVQMLLQKTQAPTISDEELEKIVEKVISENEKAVNDYKQGKEPALMFLVGQVMRAAKGQADAETIKKILRRRI